MGEKKKVLFVGAFVDEIKDGSTGGQLFACSSLVNSVISEHVDWVLLDTTGVLPPLPAYRRGLRAANRMVKLLFILTTKKIDSILIFSSHGGSFIEKGLMARIAKKFGAKVIFAPRSGAFDSWVEGNARIKSFARKVFEATDVIVCQGTYWKETFGRLFPNLKQTRLEVIPNWLDYETIVSRTSEQAIVSSETVEVLYLAWVVKTKGIFELIEAASMLSSKGLNIKYHICGDGVALEEAKEKATEMGLDGEMIFHGWTLKDKKYHHLRNADIFVLPTYYEGFPNALLEAMSVGLPSIVTKVGAVGDVLDGENGVEIAVKDSKAIADAIELLALNPELRQSIGEKGKQTVLNKFTVESAVKSFKKVL